MSHASLAHHLHTLARYNQWASARLLDAVAALDDADYRRDVGLFFRSIHGTLNHLLVGEHHLWFVRFSQGLSPRVALDAELESGRALLDARLREGAARWAPLIAGWPAERWGTTLDLTQKTCRSVRLNRSCQLASTPTCQHLSRKSCSPSGIMTAPIG